MTTRRQVIALPALAALGAPAFAQSDTVKVGVILPITGQQASTGRQIDAAIKLWVAQNGKKVGGKTIEVIVKDDGSVPDATRRLAAAWAPCL